MNRTKYKNTERKIDGPQMEQRLTVFFFFFFEERDWLSENILNAKLDGFDYYYSNESVPLSATQWLSGIHYWAYTYVERQYLWKCEKKNFFGVSFVGKNSEKILRENTLDFIRYHLRDYLRADF